MENCLSPTQHQSVYRSTSRRRGRLQRDQGRARRASQGLRDRRQLRRLKLVSSGGVRRRRGAVPADGRPPAWRRSPSSPAAHQASAATALSFFDTGTRAGGGQSGLRLTIQSPAQGPRAAGAASERQPDGTAIQRRGRRAPRGAAGRDKASRPVRREGREPLQAGSFVQRTTATGRAQRSIEGIP